jgi:hypothetical protein
LKDGARGFLRFIGAVPRTGFILITRFNVYGIAKGLSNTIATADGLDALKHKWYNLGGTWGDLHDAIEDGKDKKMMILGAQVGVTGAEISAALAAAAPIIYMLAEFIKRNNPDAAPAIDAAMNGMNSLLQMAGYDPIKTASTAKVPITIVDPVTGKPQVLYPPGYDETDQDLMSWVKKHPELSALGVGAIIYGIYQLTKKRGNRAA